jgi:hypothetical protein
LPEKLDGVIETELALEPPLGQLELHAADPAPGIRFCGGERQDFGR